MNSIVLAQMYINRSICTTLPSLSCPQSKPAVACTRIESINIYGIPQERYIFCIKENANIKVRTKVIPLGALPTMHMQRGICAIALVACCNVAPNKPHLQLPCKSDLHVCSTSCCGFGIQKDIKACIDANQKIKNNSHQCLQLKNRHLSPSSLLHHRPGQCAYVQWICVMPRSETDCMQSIIHIPCMDIIFICHLYILSICRYQIYLSCTSCIHADQLFYRVSKAAYLITLSGWLSTS